ncbi:uncharacterized protein LOC121796903 [Salvia splendens]|uniref:uncharacterized protein LOC121790294 n=1 Tax=Salvia splendens TaxID=180675 RepID=UPI001C26F017|nr:uncharacterized protein LOC121790294 [Salvia splendens]XP_042051605.1 uncharacterized protein LOC121796903 [Salvia splendens]
MLKLIATDFQSLVKLYERTHEFPGMLGSIICMNWEWENYPTVCRGQFTNGYKGTHSTMTLEAITNQRLWIWHACFVVAWSNNDIDILNTSHSSPTNAMEMARPSSSLPTDAGIIWGTTWSMTYTRGGLFFEDDHHPNGSASFFFAQRQEVVQKDVNRPTNFWYKAVIVDVMYTSIILHNMIVNDEGARVTEWDDEEARPSPGVVTPPHVRGLPMDNNEVLAAYHNAQPAIQCLPNVRYG